MTILIDIIAELVTVLHKPLLYLSPSVVHACHRLMPNCCSSSVTRAASVATLDEQNACKTSSRDVPQLKRVPSRKIHERLYVWLRQDEIADQKCPAGS